MSPTAVLACPAWTGPTPGTTMRGSGAGCADEPAWSAPGVRIGACSVLAGGFPSGLATGLPSGTEREGGEALAPPR